MKKYYDILSALLILVAVGVVATVLEQSNFFYKQPASTARLNVESKIPPVRVITKPASMLNNTRIFEAIGTGKAQKSIWVYPAVTEEVREIYFQAGQFVSKGDILVQLDDRQEQLAIELAKRELQNAKQLLVRYEETINDSVIAVNEIESKRLAVDTAEVKLKQAKLNWKERRVLAAFDGVVGITRVNVGDRVNSNTILTSLDDRSIILVDFNVPEVLAGHLQTEMEAKLTTPVYPQKTFTGTIQAIESRFDAQTRTVQIRTQVINEKDLLRPGMSFTIQLKIPGGNYPTVPEISLKWGRKGSYVWVIRDQKAHQVSARVVARTNQLVLVDAAIQADEPIVIEGTQRLREGREVVTTGQENSSAKDKETYERQVGQ